MKARLVGGSAKASQAALVKYEGLICWLDSQKKPYSHTCRRSSPHCLVTATFLSALPLDYLRQPPPPLHETILSPASRS